MLKNPEQRARRAAFASAESPIIYPPSRETPGPRLLEGAVRSRKSIWVIVLFTAIAGVLFGKTFAVRGAHSPSTVEGVLFDAVLQPSSEFNVTSRNTGTVQRILVKPGDHIEEGEPLMLISDPDAEATLRQARLELDQVSVRVARLRVQVAKANAQLAIAQRAADHVPTRQWRDSVSRASAAFEQAQTRYQRAQSLYAAGIMARQEFEGIEAEFRMAEDDLANSRKQDEASHQVDDLTARAAKAQANVALAEQQQALQSAQSRVDAAQQRVDAVRVCATSSGIVAQVLASAGDQVSISTPLLHVVDIDSLFAEVPVSASAITLLSVGRRAEVMLPTIPPERVSGQIEGINPIPSANMLHSVRVRIQNPKRVLLVKQKAKVRFL